VGINGTTEREKVGESQTLDPSWRSRCHED
jgi:hypothetical protein